MDTIQKELYLWANLAIIKLNNIGLKDIGYIYKLTNLDELDLSNNKINVISDKIINLNKLKSLQFSYNQI